MHITKRWILLLGVLVSGVSAAQSDDRQARMLERFDTDGDGQLSDSERAAAQEARGQNGRRGGDFQARRAEILERFDTDGDGRLNDSERAALRESGEMRRGGGRGERGRGGEKRRKGEDPNDS